MTQAPLFLVAGFGRCGLTATMHLLWRGGAPVVGQPPSFEDSRFGLSESDPAWIAAQRGKVLKYVDPSVDRLPDGIPIRSVWLDRDPREQARSQMKFIETLSGQRLVPYSPKRLGKSLVRDRPRALARLRRGGPVLVLRFEDLLAEPLTAARRIAVHFGAEILPDPAAGARAILPRGPHCRPDLVIETRLLEAANREETSASTSTST